jgi:WD40 repeat protein/DNA-binding SARP family transcriptional activator
MEFRILGPLEVLDERGPVPVLGGKPRSLLALLLLHANEPVSAERIAMALWGEEAPARATKTVQVNVSRLRKALGGADTIETSPAGYRLRVRPGELDLERFEHLVSDGRRALADGEPQHAAELLRAALELWRGPPLADLAATPFAQAEISQLEEQRLGATEARVEADLACGREAEVAGELRHLVAEHPARERLVAHLMLALYRCGRQSDALDAYREARRRLVEEIGVEPGHELRRLQAAILRQDPSLVGEHGTRLPRELEDAAGERLVGRELELAWLREQWRRAGAGAGAVVTLSGEKGIGKSRLAAELAAEAHEHGATVLFADAAGPSPDVLRVFAQTRGTRTPTLLIVDDADQAAETVHSELEALAVELAKLPVLAVVLSERNGSREDGLTLKPLDADAVFAIVTRYAPDEDADAPPTDWLMGATRGVPKLVHELARQWARREAGRRVVAAASRTARGRTDLRSMEQELAADVVVLEAARAREPSHVSDSATVCPFKGLATFQVADAPYFFGRERLVAELVARLVGAPLLGIVGASGSGKSSLLRAGLLPALAAGVLPGSERAHQILMRPGSHPIAELHGALARSPASPIVLAIDQFEEAFTVCQDEAERAEFFEEVIRMAHRGDGEGVVALAMRADFYGRCSEHAELSRLLSAGHVLVGPMHEDELRRAIECPAQRVGLVVDPELVDALVSDVDGEPGALPLLSTALLEQWQQRDGRRMRLVTYEHAGGVRGAVARLGETAYGGLDEAQRRIARAVLLRLVAFDEAGGVERRSLASSELGGDDAVAVARLLADRRLLTIAAGTVELAHEALLREWPRLREWIEEDRDMLRGHERLRIAAREWLRLDRDDGALLRGAQLAEAEALIDPQAPELADFERDFLVSSLRRRGRERATRRHRVELTIGGLSALLVGIAVVAVIAVQKRHQAERERNVALAQSLSTQSQEAVDTDPELALRLALTADQLAPTSQSGAALRQATLAFHQIGVLPADRLTAYTAAVSPDGRTIVTGGDTGEVRLWDASTHHEIARLAEHDGKVLSARFSADGRQIVLGFQHGAVRVTDSRLHRARKVLQTDVNTRVERAVFSRDAGFIAAALDDGTVRIIELKGGQDRTLVVPGDVEAFGVAVDARGRIAAAYSDGAVRLWNAGGAGSRQLLGPRDSNEIDVNFSPDGRRLLAVGEDGKARLWNTDTGDPIATLTVGPRPLTSGSFSRDGSRFATAGWDGAVRVWTTKGASLLLTMRGQLSRIFDASFGATSDRLLSAGDDGTARIWNAGGLTTVTGDSVTYTVDVSADGRWFATGNRDGGVRIWDAHTGALRRTEPGPPGFTWARFSPATDALAIGREASESVSVWPLADPHPRVVARLTPSAGRVVARFALGGRLLGYVGQDDSHQIFVRDTRTGDTIRLGGAPSSVYDAHVSPDGRQVASSTESGTILLWRLDRPAAPYRSLPGHGAIDALDWSRDGRIVTANADMTVRVIDPVSGHRIVMHGHTAEVYNASFTPDGRYVISSSDDGTARLWDSRSGGQLAILQSGEYPIYDLSIGADGTFATVDEREVVRVARCQVCESDAKVRALANSLHPRELTKDERARFLTDAG